MEKTVTVYNTRGANRKDLNNISASTWRELQDVFDQNGIAWSGMTAIEGQSQTPLISGETLLPQGNIIVFLFPSKVFSGLQVKLGGCYPVRYIADRAA